ncbi:pre-rRNA processing protein [Entomophthora muscae]|uniref:Pre-rRNA processing protein n=2 Tax=Entomophthora muscae TaxID=34485 RepID=A0ACC2UEM1_9FUNG|nr:pre-rRNA processing protein [Entomophthora muscae]KAJ9085244.1 pre-rRNA processing protein [Entomophthora muscae]
MEDTLVRIRSQAVSKLDNQKQVAITLQVVEATLASKGQELIPSAYAALLLTLLEQDEGSNRPSLMYLLNVVFKELPETLLRAKCEEFIRIFFVVLNEDSEKASIIKSAIGCFEVLLKAQDKNSWSHPKVKEAFQYLLGLCADQRPKVRRGAQDAVCSILNSSRSAVGVVIVTDFCLNQLKRIRKTSASSASNEAVPFLSFLKQVSVHWTPQDLQRLNGPLMSLTKLNNAFITTLVYQTMATVIAQLDPAQLETLIETIIIAKPNYNETESFGAWLVSIKEGFSGLFSKSPMRFFSALPALLELLLKDLEGANKAVNACIGENMSELILSFNMEGLDAMEVAQVIELDRIFRMLQDSLTYRFRNAWPQLFCMLQSLYKVFGASQPQSVIATLEILDAMRHEEGFEFKAEVDRALGAAIASLGPRRFLSILPLNLETPGEKTIGRAWLLPVLKEHINNTELSFFSKEMLSLADRLEARSKDFEAQGKAIEAKVYATLHHQIWSLFPSFASFPLELTSGFTDEFAERVANKIYSDAELRPILFNGLALLIESNRRLSLDEELHQRYQIDQNAAQANLAHLSKFATNYLFVFFSIYSAASSNMRTLVLKVILTFLAISPSDKIEAAFADVASRFDPNPSGEEATQTCAVMLDLAIVMIPYLQEASVLKLLELSVHYLPGEFDGTLQKRAYKSLNKLLDTWQTIVLPQLSNIESALLDAGMYTDSSAVKDRMNFLSKYIPLLPTSNMHVFSRLTSEAILGAKEVNEKARESAFDVLVIMAQKMSEADPSQVGASGEAASSLEEFMNVVLAGLTGTTPHMISATISALSRLLFDFHKKLSPEKISELIETIELFVGSSNREIVKASLGFVKVVTVALEARHLQPHLGMLLNSILVWSNDNQSRFKVKVRHIIERLIRRFGMETIEAVFPEKHAKLIANIRRRKLRAKRQVKPAEKDEKVAVGKRTLGNAFDEALYGSESEIDSGDEDAQVAAPGLKRKANAMAASYIKEDKFDDTPIDFLDRGAISRISGHKPKKAPTSDKLKTAFAMSNDGRLVFADDSDSEKEAPAETVKGEDFYKQSVDSKEGFTRVNNRIKFKKGQDKEEGSDTEMGSSKTNKRSKTAAPPRRNPGSEFKAKNADGDVKKKGKLDPYAYIPLNPKMMAKKGKNFSKVSIMKKK